MDSDGLPLIGTGIDLQKVDPLNQKQTLAYLNHFVVRTAQFLNKFASVCEDKMEVLSIRLRQLEISMNILEAKLSSIPGLDEIQVPIAEASFAKSAQTTAESSSLSTLQNTTQRVDIQSLPDDQPSPRELTEEVGSSATVPVSKHSDYVPFFKLLNLGVPPAALKPKMMLQGLNPDLIDTPNAQIPAGAISNSEKSAVTRKERKGSSSNESSDSNSSMSDSD